MDMNTGEILSIVATIISIIGSVLAAGGLVIKKLKKYLAENALESTESTFKKYEKLNKEQLENLEKELRTFKEEQSKTNKMIKHNLLSTTRDRINEAHQMLSDRTEIDQHALYILEELYKSYKDLGGNSFIDRQMDDIRELKIKN